MLHIVDLLTLIIKNGMLVIALLIISTKSKEKNDGQKSCKLSYWIK